MADHEEEFEQLIIPEAGADIDEEIGYDIPQELNELGIDINEFFQITYLMEITSFCKKQTIFFVLVLKLCLLFF